MKNDKVQPLNYCAHAIDDMRELAETIQYTSPASANVIRKLIDLLHHSVKFILPNCCNLIDPDEMRQAHLDLVRLPFRCAAFEVPWVPEESVLIDGFEQIPATKRIALCWEPQHEIEVLPGLNSILEAFPEGGAFIMPIYWTPEVKKWTIAAGGIFLPYDNAILDVGADQSFGFLPASRIANSAVIKAGLAKENGKQFRVEPFYVLPEIFDQTVAMYGDREKAYAHIMLNSRDETLIVIQACSVLNCANVTTAEIRAPAALNVKRQRKGKQPFFSYKVLQLADERRESGSGGVGSGHASPRMHLRRGHLRRLENKVIWVRPTMVNAGSYSGMVLKDYAVQRKRE